MYIRTQDGLGRLPTSYFYDSSMGWVGNVLSDVTPPTGPITVANLASSLTNLVFWARHPKLKGKTLKAKSKEAIEWGRIWKDEVKPALHHSSTELRIARLIFDVRHPKILDHIKEQPKDKQQKLWQEFEEIIKKIVRPWLTLQLARGRVNSRTIFVIDNNAFRNLPADTRNRIGTEIASQFSFVNGNAPMTVIFLNPDRFPEAFNFSDAVVGITDPMTPAQIHVYWALRQQVNNLNRSIDALGSRQRLPPPDRSTLNPERPGTALMNKSVTAASQGTRVAAPLMACAVHVNEVISFLNKEHVPDDKQIPKERDKWTDGQKELVGIALGRAMAHEVRHLYVRDPIHAADGLGTTNARLFGTESTFSATDKASIKAAITSLEADQGTRAVAASFAAAERSFDFPF